MSCCLCLVLLLRVAGVSPPNRSSILLSARHACPFYLDQHIDVFSALPAANSVLASVIAASVDPFRSPIDFSALCEFHSDLWLSWDSYVARVRGFLPSVVSAAAFVLSRKALF